MNARSLTEARLDLLDDRLARDIVEQAQQGIRDDIAEIKRQIEGVPIAGDIVRFRALLAARSRLTVLEVRQIEALGREVIARLHEDYHKPLDSVWTLVNVLDEIGASPEVEDGIVHIACLSHADMMRIGGDLRQHAPQLADAIIDASRYDKIGAHLWWGVEAITRRAA